VTRPTDQEALAEASSEAEREGEHASPSSSMPAGRPARISSVSDVVSLPVLWLDRLVLMTQEVPFDRGEDGLIHGLVGALERIVPEVRVAIRLPRVTTPFRSSPPPRQVFGSEPPTSNERVRAARVFPDATHERSVTLPGPIGVGALHFAAEEDLFTGDGAPHVQLMDRAAHVISHALARCRAEERMNALDGELRTSKALMVQAEKLASFGQIAAGMVHELNNPLTSIAAYTDFLLRRAIAREGSDADDVERLRRIAESANRMLRFTRDLVSYARPSADVPIAVSINTVIERALAFCEHEVVDAQVQVLRRLEPDVGLVRGLPEQLAQVFVNLVTNACHAMATPRESGASDFGQRGGDAHPRRAPLLTITTERHAPEADTLAEGEDEVVVVVQDTGCGIRKENLEQVFAPFFTTKGPGQGTGLGLSIVKNIVEGHRGKIRAESDPSFGTRFILRFPVEPSGVPSVSGEYTPTT